MSQKQRLQPNIPRLVRVRRRVFEGPLETRQILLAGASEFNRWRMSHPDRPVELSEADLRGLDLRNVYLAGAQMNDCLLDDVDLRGSILTGASLIGASFRRADLRGAQLGALRTAPQSSKMYPSHAALCTPAVLREAVLDGARCDETSFVGVDLRQASLRETELRNAYFQGARLENAVVTRAPSTEDLPALLARLSNESLSVRAAMAHALESLVPAELENKSETRSFVQTAIAALCVNTRLVKPSGPPMRLESPWASRAFFMLMCAAVRSSQPPSPAQLAQLGRWGSHLGYSPRALTRILAAELGVVAQNDWLG